MCELKPSNDVCELILGINDYLTTALPNLHQMSCSNLSQVKKNKVLNWLSELPEAEQLAVLDMAGKKRRYDAKEYRDEEHSEKKELGTVAYQIYFTVIYIIYTVVQ